MRRVAKLLPIVLVAALLTGGRAAAFHEDLPVLASRDIASGEWVAFYSSIAELSAGADAAARVRVTAVSGPRWNSQDGRPWDGDGSVTPSLITEISVEVEHTYFGDLGAGPLSLLVYGDARSKPRREHFEHRVPANPDHLSGGFARGEQHILLLAVRGFGFRGGATKNAWTVHGRFQGNWLIDGEMALNFDRHFQMPVVRLTDLLRRDE